MLHKVLRMSRHSTKGLLKTVDKKQKNNKKPTETEILTELLHYYCSYKNMTANEKHDEAQTHV